ncbi:MAG: hypothetical protein IJH63_00780 [Methanobrevibacter sp.]|nr:hypothetical protein [Methanosphaera sp.]MBR0369239.1 hypothetical protein [Methanobrevibacter sp.]
MSIHDDCEHFNKTKDYCLKYFTDNVSKEYQECQEKTVFDDNELSRKWSN